MKLSYFDNFFSFSLSLSFSFKLHSDFLYLNKNNKYFSFLFSMFWWYCCCCHHFTGICKWKSNFDHWVWITIGLVLGTKAWWDRIYHFCWFYKTRWQRWCWFIERRIIGTHKNSSTWCNFRDAGKNINKKTEKLKKLKGTTPKKKKFEKIKWNKFSWFHSKQ